MSDSGLADGLSNFDYGDLPESENDLIFLGGEMFMDMLGRITDVDGEVRHADDLGSHDYLLRWSLDSMECTLCLATLDKAIDCVPDKAFLYLHRGIAHEARLENVPAMADFCRAIKLEPANGNAYFERGWLNLKIGRYDKAATDFRTALRLGFLQGSLNKQKFNGSAAVTWYPRGVCIPNILRSSLYKEKCQLGKVDGLSGLNQTLCHPVCPTVSEWLL